MKDYWQITNIARKLKVANLALLALKLGLWIKIS